MNYEEARMKIKKLKLKTEIFIYDYTSKALYILALYLIFGGLIIKDIEFLGAGIFSFIASLIFRLYANTAKIKRIEKLLEAR